VEKAMQMYQWCNRNEVSLMALNYKFILDHSAVITIVIGASSKEEVRDSLPAYKENIAPEVMSSFRKQFDLHKNLLPINRLSL
jgi:predicted aldo/keto reductase-like oxidoreductase